MFIYTQRDGKHKTSAVTLERHMMARYGPSVAMCELNLLQLTRLKAHNNYR
jgi:hypothetical protein